MEKMELIELGLNEVARECRIIERVAAESRFCIELMEAKGKPADSVYHDMANEHEAMLNDVHQKVVELLEFVGEYMNCHDMIGAVDVAINKTIYDLVYERTDETSYECNKED